MKHWWLLIIPAVLDMFLWLGPRLSFQQIIERMVRLWEQEAVFAGLDTNMLLELAPRTNLFSSLSIPVIGVPAYFVGAMPEKMPIGVQVFELHSVWTWALYFLLLSLAGLLLTTVYFTLMAQVSRSHASAAGSLKLGLVPFFKAVAILWLKLLGFLLVLIAAGLAFYIPLVLISGLLSLFSAGLATLVLFSGPVFAIWLLFYFCFVPHGLIMYGRPLWRAIVESVQLVQRNLLSVMGMFLVIVGVNRLLDMLLLAADDGSWFTLVSILGHAFIGTALILTTFIFYRDRYEIFQYQLSGHSLND